MTLTDSEAPTAEVGAQRRSYDVVVAASAVAAFGASFSGVTPTGTSWWDPLLAATLAVMFVVAATRAHQWELLELHR